MQTQTNSSTNTNVSRKANRKAKAPKAEAPVSVEQAVVNPTTEPTQPKPKRSLAATMARYRGGYVDGRHCGDDIAARLAGMSLEAIYAEAERVCGLEPGTLEAKYASLNHGQQRMNAGNRIRAAAKKAAKARDAEIAALMTK
jgi:hypothetical protein